MIGELKKKPALVAHSFGGLITQILAGRGAAAVSVAIDHSWRDVAGLAVAFVQEHAQP